MIYEVKVPILGFEHVKQVEVKEFDDNLFQIFDVNTGMKLFTVISPFSLTEKYDIEVPENFQVTMGLSDTTPMQVFCILILNHSDVYETKVNFIAPLILNDIEKTIGQVILKAANNADSIPSIREFIS
jgi:flagellar assembly factor FliW